MPPPPKPAKPCNCPPRVYRNPPDVIVAAGDNVTVEETQGDAQVTYTVSAQVPEQKPVKVDPELMYGDGVKTPLGVYEYDGETAGLVPDAPAEPENKFLRADGTWQTVEIPEQSQSDWLEQDTDAPSYIKNKPELATVATTGSYDDLTDKPTIKQSDWAQDDDTQEDFIKHKPGVYAGSDAGLVPPGRDDDHEKFLRGDGSWETVITDMPDFIGATANEDGVRGVVPAPQAGDQNKFLCGNGSWDDVENTRECTVNEMNDWLDEADQEASNG